MSITSLFHWDKHTLTFPIAGLPTNPMNAKGWLHSEFLQHFIKSKISITNHVNVYYVFGILKILFLIHTTTNKAGIIRFTQLRS